jgi:hypothetical protein
MRKIILFTYLILILNTNLAYSQIEGIGYRDFKIGDPISSIKKYCSIKSSEFWKCYGSTDKWESFRFYIKADDNLTAIDNYNYDQFRNMKIAGITYTKLYAYEDNIKNIQNAMMKKYKYVGNYNETFNFPDSHSLIKDWYFFNDGNISFWKQKTIYYYDRNDKIFGDTLFDYSVNYSVDEIPYYDKAQKLSDF